MGDQRRLTSDLELDELARMQAEELARSLDEAEEELRREGPVPPAEVARVLEDIFAEYEAEMGRRPA